MDTHVAHYGLRLSEDASPYRPIHSIVLASVFFVLSVVNPPSILLVSCLSCPDSQRSG